jgi:two-component system sensor histidine kinase AlgZ
MQPIAPSGGGSPGPLLPPELPWLYVVIPLPAAYLMGHDLLGQPWPRFLRALLEMYLPFMVYGSAFHLVYRYVMPPLLRRAKARFGRLGRAALQLAPLAIVTPLVAVALLPLMRHVLHKRMPALDFLIVSSIFSSACILPGLAVQRLRLRAQSAEHRALVERKVSLEAQLSALQARTDPHFLFNSLNTVASLISEDPVLAERTLERLSDLFRYALDASQMRTVKLERELAMITDYLELQSARFGTRLHTRLSVERGLAELEIPPLLLQPLIENAIVHGMSARREGRVDVTIRRQDDQLLVEISDDGPGPGRSEHSGAGTAVAVVIERIRLHYAGRGSLRLEPQPEGGCLARLALPLGGLS